MAERRVSFVVQFASADRAIEATDVLYGNELWVQRFDDRVAVYVPPGQQPPRIEKALWHALREGGMNSQVIGEPRKLVWNTRTECFVDPDDPAVDGILGTLIEDAEFEASESKWTVTVRPRSIFVHRATRGQLVALRRPFLEATGEHYVLGAWDERDARSMVEDASRLTDVRDATATKLSWRGRWRLRQQFSGNYGVTDPSVGYLGATGAASGMVVGAANRAKWGCEAFHTIAKRPSTLALSLLLLTAAACGGESTRSARSVRACVDDRLAPGAVDRVLQSTVDGVTTLTYMQRGGETLVSVFPSESAAKDAAEAEARIGDAHDQRLRNVLYGNGGTVGAAVEACLR